MRIESDLLNSNIPSHNMGILCSMIGATLIQATRYSWLQPQAALTEYKLDAESVFSLTEGPLALKFSSGLCVGFASEPSIHSVICWMESSGTGIFRAAQLGDDTELYPVSISDRKYSRFDSINIIDKTISNVDIYTQKPKHSKYASLPSEVAVTICFSSGSIIWITHGLHDGSDDFAVLESSQIPKDAYLQLLRKEL